MKVLITSILVLLAFASWSGAAEQKPNIILILADDK